MDEFRKQNFNTTVQNLIRNIATIDQMMVVNNQNRKQYEDTKSAVDTLTKLADVTKEKINHCTDIYKNICFYIEQRKALQIEELTNYIRSVSDIVPDADLSTCTIKHENGKTKILDGNEQDINLREGGAARSTLGVFMKFCTIKAQPNRIQLLMLDEDLSRLSAETSVNLRPMLMAMSKEMGIVGIEQRSITYESISSKMYKVTKSGKVSTVREVKENGST